MSEADWFYPWPRLFGKCTILKSFSHIEKIDNPDHRDMPEIWNMVFLKQHNLSVFPDKPFWFSDGMSGFCDIAFQKWRGLSEKSKLSL